jgi:hypothetical protein
MTAVPSAYESIVRAKALVAEGQFLAALEVVSVALLDPQCDYRVDLLVMQARVMFSNLNRPREGLEVIEAAYRSYPKNETVLRVLARLRHLTGAPVSAFAIYKGLYRSGDSSGEAVEGLFSILMEARRYSMAARLAPQIGAKHSLTSRRARDLAELAIARRDVDGAFAMLGLARQLPNDSGLDQLQVVAERLKAELAAGDTMAGRRHLAIGGSAFCGSTTLGVILGSMPGYAFAGETHWLTNTRTAEGLLESIVGTAVPELKWPIACRACDRDCEYFDVLFRVALAEDSVGWYAKIADRLGVENLVSADKNFQLFEEHDPLFRFDYILCYKEPISYLRSLLKQFLRQPGPPKPLTTQWAIVGLERWADNYMRHLKSVRPVGRRVVFNWDAFVTEPHFHLRRLAQVLDIPLGPETLEHIRPGHFIGGNNGVDISALRADGALRLRKSNAPPLPLEIHEVALAHKGSQRVARILGGEYRRDFRPGA